MRQEADSRDVVMQNEMSDFVIFKEDAKWSRNGDRRRGTSVARG